MALLSLSFCLESLPLLYTDLHSRERERERERERGERDQERYPMSEVCACVCKGMFKNVLSSTHTNRSTCTFVHIHLSLTYSKTFHSLQLSLLHRGNQKVPPSSVHTTYPLTLSYIHVHTVHRTAACPAYYGQSTYIPSVAR